MASRTLSERLYQLCVQALAADDDFSLSLPPFHGRLCSDDSGSISRDEWKAGWARGYVTLGVSQAAAYAQEEPPNKVNVMK